jgi:acyltransferase-like protein
VYVEPVRLSLVQICWASADPISSSATGSYGTGTLLSRRFTLTSLIHWVVESAGRTSWPCVGDVWRSAPTSQALERNQSTMSMAKQRVLVSRDGAPTVRVEAGPSDRQSALPQNRLGTSQPPRIVPIDNLKSLLVAWVIAGHAILGYTVIGGWPYDEVTEATLPRSLELILATGLGPTALFVMGTFFFLSGLITPRTIARDGPAAFIRQRLLRLGVPWLTFTLVVWPVLMWLAYRSAGYSFSLWQVMRIRQPFLDSGPLWFVQILLYVSVVHALLMWTGGRLRLPVRMTLVMAVVAITVVSFVIRLWFPARSQQILDLHVWQWPQCMGLYLVGVMVARHGWAERVPSRTARRCGIAVLAAVAAGVMVTTVLGISDLKRDGTPFLGGWHLQALALDVVEATLVVAGSVWLLAWAQRRLTSRAAGVSEVARAAYAAYLLQAPVLLGLEISARSLDWPAVAKAILVAALAVAGSFGLGWLIIHRARSGEADAGWARPKALQPSFTAAAPSDAPEPR